MSPIRILFALVKALDSNVPARWMITSGYRTPSYSHRYSLSVDVTPERYVTSYFNSPPLYATDLSSILARVSSWPEYAEIRRLLISLGLSVIFLIEIDHVHIGLINLPNIRPGSFLVGELLDTGAKARNMRLSALHEREKLVPSLTVAQVPFFIM